MIIKISNVPQEVLLAAIPLRNKIRVGLRIADDLTEYPPSEALYWDESEFDIVHGEGSFEETLKFYEKVFAGEN